MRLGFIGNVGFNGGRLKTKETEEEPLEQGKGCGGGGGEVSGRGQQCTQPIGQGC